MTVPRKVSLHPKWPLGRHLQTSNQLFESQSSEALSHNVPVIEFS